MNLDETEAQHLRSPPGSYLPLTSPTQPSAQRRPEPKDETKSDEPKRIPFPGPIHSFPSSVLPFHALGPCIPNPLTASGLLCLLRPPSSPLSAISNPPNRRPPRRARFQSQQTGTSLVRRIKPLVMPRTRIPHMMLLLLLWLQRVRKGRLGSVPDEGEGEVGDGDAAEDEGQGEDLFAARSGRGQGSCWGLKGEIPWPCKKSAPQTN